MSYPKRTHITIFLDILEKLRIIVDRDIKNQTFEKILRKKENV